MVAVQTVNLLASASSGSTPFSRTHIKIKEMIYIFVDFTTEDEFIKLS